MFNFLRNTILFSGHIYHLPFHQVVHKFYNIFTSCQNLLFSIFLKRIMALLMGTEWYLTTVLICISLMVCDVEFLSICLWVICKFSLGKCLLKCLFFKQIAYFYYWINRRTLYIQVINSLSYIQFANIFLILLFTFYFVECVLWCIKVFGFDEVQFIIFSFVFLFLLLK